MSAWLLDWASLLVRWLHLITGIAWVGASFYFVWLDNHLRPSGRPGDTERGVFGDVWSVHGGGFYHNEKFLLGPRGEPLSDHLHWFKWEAYWTWISGMLLLGLVYWLGAAVYLIDRSVASLSVPAAIAISAAFLAGGWLAYDIACRTIRNETALGIVVAGIVVLADLALFELFSPRAAYIHVGAMIGTIMVANVFFVIIPGQKKMVDAIRAGRPPDPAPGLRGKQRSVHNTYLTLPVLFIMISTHYPMTYSHRYGAAVLLAVSAAGVLIRQFFVLRHRGRATWLLPAAAVALLAATAAATMPRSGAAVDRVDLGDPAARQASVLAIVAQRCATCHSAMPSDAVFTVAPAGVMFDTAEQIETMAQRIYQRSVITRDMPMGNTTAITDAERGAIAAWYEQRDDGAR